MEKSPLNGTSVEAASDVLRKQRQKEEKRKERESIGSWERKVEGGGEAIPLHYEREAEAVTESLAQNRRTGRCGACLAAVSRPVAACNPSKLLSSSSSLVAGIATAC